MNSMARRGVCRRYSPHGSDGLALILAAAVAVPAPVPPPVLVLLLLLRIIIIIITIIAYEETVMILGARGRYPPEWVSPSAAGAPHMEEDAVPYRETWEAMEALVR